MIIMDNKSVNEQKGADAYLVGMIEFVNKVELAEKQANALFETLKSIKDIKFRIDYRE